MNLKDPVPPKKLTRVLVMCYMSIFKEKYDQRVVKKANVQKEPCDSNYVCRVQGCPTLKEEVVVHSTLITPVLS